MVDMGWCYWSAADIESYYLVVDKVCLVDLEVAAVGTRYSEGNYWVVEVAGAAEDILIYKTIIFPIDFF